MGVSGFNSFLRRRYPGAYRVLTQEDLEANPVDHLYIDLASTLHQTVRRGKCAGAREGEPQGSAASGLAAAVAKRGGVLFRRCAAQCISTKSRSSVTAAAAARTRAYFYFLLHKRLDAILACVKPRKRVVIALDGPAPLAKLLEQR